MKTPPMFPVEGLTRCSCGSKYWDADVCHSCGEPYGAVNKVPYGILTVGELIEYLKGVDPNTHVLMDDEENGWWSNISEVHVPNGIEDYEKPCVTFVRGVPFSTRQI
jgi:hypothetical protein